MSEPVQGSMAEWRRTDVGGALRDADVGREVVLCGWVHAPGMRPDVTRTWSAAPDRPPIWTSRDRKSHV